MSGTPSDQPKPRPAVDVASALARADEQKWGFRVRVRRQDAASDARSKRWEEFELPWSPGLSVHDCLEAIERDPRTVRGERVSAPAWDASCVEGRCGACTMLVNGRPRQACVTLVDPLMLEKNAASVELEPLSKFPILRDLVVDRSRARESLRRVKAWVELEGDEKERSEPPAKRRIELAQAAGSLSPCIGCGACLEACPEVHEGSKFVGAAMIHEARLVVEHQPGSAAAGERVDSLMGPGGVAECGKSQNCVEVCPVSLPLDESIAAMARASTKRLFSGWLRKR
jgi:succinate dehydrogenase / fumarate reductase, iron-sulfur subunit